MGSEIGISRSSAGASFWPPAEHEWVTVGDRRWCLGCVIFQRHTAGAWRPWTSVACAETTPHAQAERATARNKETP
jgi:hypothetical protein